MPPTMTAERIARGQARGNSGQTLCVLRLPKLGPSTWLALAVSCMLCVQGTGMDAVSGLNAARAVASFAPGRTGAVKVKGNPKFKKPPFRIPKMGKRVVRSSLVHLKRMIAHSENATVMREGCEHMTEICMSSNEQDALGRHRGACAAVAVTLKRHMSNEGVVLAALKLACNLCYAQPRSPMGFAGWAHTYSQGELGVTQEGITDIVKAMQFHQVSAEVQDAGIRALTNLVYNHTENVHLAVKDGAAEAVLAAMKAHPSDMRVQEGGCIFVWSLVASIKHEKYITYGIEMTGAPGGGRVRVDLSVAGWLAEIGMVPAVIHALNAFGCEMGSDREGINVGEQGCAALWFLSTKPGRLRSLIIESGGVSLAEKVLHEQAEVPPARTWAARLLQQLTGRDFSQYLMPMQVPGPNVRQRALQEVKDCKWQCPYYCGCNGTWGINRVPSVGGRAGKVKRNATTTPGVAAVGSADVPERFHSAKAAAMGGEQMSDSEDEARGDSNVCSIEFSAPLSGQSGSEDLAGSGGEHEDDGGRISYHTSSEEARAALQGAHEDAVQDAKDRDYMARVGKFKQKDAQAKKARQVWERQRHKLKQKGSLRIARETARKGFTPLGREDQY